MTRRRPTIEDVAREVGVSRQTVSRALNDQGRIDPETKRKVLVAVDVLGYRPSRFARGLVKQDVVTVGVIVPTLANPFYPEVIDGITSVVRRWGGQVLLGLSEATPDGEYQALQHIQAQADAVIGCMARDDPRVYALAATLPCVRIDGQYGPAAWPGIPIDYETGVRLAVERLARTGHREVGMLDAIIECPGYSRRDGFLRLAPEYGLRCDPSRIVTCEESYTGGMDGLNRLLTAHPDLTGVFAFNDLIAIGALRGARQCGITVPDDCAIIGFDGLALGEIVSPQLTTVHIDAHRLGVIAAEHVRLLLDGTAQAGPPLPMLTPSLRIRESA
jgi:LacI family transcriptional regulator